MLSSHLPAKFALAVQIQVANLSGRLLYNAATSGDTLQQWRLLATLRHIDRRTSQKKFGGDGVLPKSCDICPNHDFVVLYKDMRKNLG